MPNHKHHQPASIMTEVILSDGSRDEFFLGKQGKFLPADDLIIARDVAYLRAQIAAYGMVRQTSEKVATKVNRNPHMCQKLTKKSVRDQYKRLREEFYCDDLRNRGLSGVAEGAMWELYQVLSQMREENESFLDKKQAAINEKAKKDKEKEMLGRKMGEIELLCKTRRSSDEESYDAKDRCGEKDINGSVRKKKKRMKVDMIVLSSGLAPFGEKLKEADLNRIKLYEDAIDFERHKKGRV